MTQNCDVGMIFFSHRISNVKITLIHRHDKQVFLTLYVIFVIVN